jgi:hypothetical protein
MKTILFALAVSLSLVSPAEAGTVSKTASFDQVIEKVESLKIAYQAQAVANQVRLELAKGKKKIELAKR